MSLSAYNGYDLLCGRVATRTCMILIPPSKARFAEHKNDFVMHTIHLTNSTSRSSRREPVSLRKVEYDLNLALCFLTWSSLSPRTATFSTRDNGETIYEIWRTPIQGSRLKAKALLQRTRLANSRLPAIPQSFTVGLPDLQLMYRHSHECRQHEKTQQSRYP